MRSTCRTFRAQTILPSTPSSSRYTMAAAAAIGLVLGVIPMVATLRGQALSVLREEGRSATVGRGAQSLRRILIVAQVACAFVLLIGAGLLFATFRKGPGGRSRLHRERRPHRGGCRCRTRATRTTPRCDGSPTKR
jgi:hypothetical protein